jgi:hypothetical protein
MSGSNFNPQNTQCIPVVKIFAFLELESRFSGKHFSKVSLYCVPTNKVKNNYKVNVLSHATAKHSRFFPFSVILLLQDSTI